MSQKENEDIYEKRFMLSLTRFVCRYEDEDQQQCLPLCDLLPVRRQVYPYVQICKRISVFLAQPRHLGLTAHQRVSASQFMKQLPRIFPSTWAFPQSGSNPTPKSPAVEGGTDIFIRLQIQVIKRPQEIGGQLHRRLKTARFLNVTHQWPTHEQLFAPVCH